MTQSAYANTTINNMLGWLKGFAGWVLKLFNLAGSGGISPLKWLADNWLQALVVLLIVGVVTDWLVWMMRWRPYWAWFRKRRLIIEDDDFFAGENLAGAGLDDGPARKTYHVFGHKRGKSEDWDDDDEFVVASTVVKRGGNTAKRRTSAASEDRWGWLDDQIQERERAAQEDDEGVFSLDSNATGRMDQSEDEVFNVSNLPNTADADEYDNSKKDDVFF